MRFTEYLIEAPTNKPRYRIVNGKPVPVDQLEQVPARPQQTVNFQKTRNKLGIPQQQVKAGELTPAQQRQAKAAAKPNVKPAEKNDPWSNILKAATDPNSGRSLFTLLGSMYQAKRRNPTVQLTVPDLVTTLPDKTEEQKALKQNMMALFNLAKSDDMPHLAQRSQELQKARLKAASQPGTHVQPGEQPAGQVQQTAAPQEGGTMLQQLLQQIKKLTPDQLKTVKKELTSEFEKKKPEVPNLPPRGAVKPQMVNIGGG